MDKVLKFLFKEKIVLSIVLLSMLYAFIYSLIHGKYSDVFLILLSVGIILSPYAIRTTYDIRLPRTIIIFITLFTYSSIFLGDICGFYDYYWWWDVFLHGGSAVVFGLIGLSILQMMVGAKKIKASYVVISVFAFTFSVAIGAIWEIFEFAMDEFFHTTMQDGGSLHDTMNDLIMDSLGAFIVTFLAYFHWRYNKLNFISKYLNILSKKYSDRNNE